MDGLHDVAAEIIHVRLRLDLRVAKHQHLRGGPGRAGGHAAIVETARATPAIGMRQRLWGFHINRNTGHRFRLCDRRQQQESRQE